VAVRAAILIWFGQQRFQRRSQDIFLVWNSPFNGYDAITAADGLTIFPLIANVNQKNLDRGSQVSPVGIK